eukprot:scaffold421315_cov55-Attheya_sp.AAC.2
MMVRSRLGRLSQSATTRQGRSSILPQQQQQELWSRVCFSSSSASESVVVDSDTKKKGVTLRRKREVVAQYAQGRNAYKAAVSGLRKTYAKEIAAQRQRDEEAAEKEKQRLTRQRLERQRLKNVRTAENALRQKQIKEDRHREWQGELAETAQERTLSQERFRKARQLVIDELEAEAPLWLTTREEVEAALQPGSVEEQKLWTFAGGVLGAPRPTDDAEFWRYESHTWDMSPTYPTPRELLWDEIVEQTYVGANVDEAYWTPPRKAAWEDLEERARLRALVREEGRRSLLTQQRELLRDAHETAQKDGIPKSAPVPKLDILANYKEMELEGVRILQEDPTKFFIFQESEGDSKAPTTDDDDGEASAMGTGEGRVLGKPIRVRDPTRDWNPQGTPYPKVVGRLPPPDLRTEREKKQQEREERMRMAAGGEGAEEDSTAAAVAEAAGDTLGLQGKLSEINYDTIAQTGHTATAEDFAWAQGLDPVRDADIINTPRDRRYDEEDVEWVLQKLNQRIDYLEDQVKQEAAQAKQEHMA